MDEAGRRVVVTGASGYVGAALVRRLQSESWVESIVALDVRPPRTDLGPKTHFVRHDVSLPFDGVLEEHRPDTVVHLAFVLNPGRNGAAARRVNVDGTANLLDECARIGVRKVVYLSSTTVYGAHPDNPPMLTEESPPRPAVGFQYSHGQTRGRASRPRIRLRQARRGRDRTPGLSGGRAKRRQLRRPHLP